MTAELKLTPKMRLFVERYLACWNATEAARQAGYAHAMQCSNRLMRNPKVKALIEERIGDATMQANEVMSRLTQQARLNAAMFFTFGWKAVLDDAGKPLIDENGNPVLTYAMTGVDWEVFEKFSFLVKKLSFDRFGNPVIEFHDAQRALELIGRAERLFIDRVEGTAISIEVSADDLATARAKAREFESQLSDDQG